MIEPWFAQETTRWFAFLSLLSILSVFSEYAEQGRHRAKVMLVWASGIGCGGFFLVLAAIAFISGQPPHVVRTLALAGVLIAGIFAATLPTLRRAYDEAEMRRTIASDL
jgi:cbb3-type cytochrome oxidase subunit 3